jgi:hypothetical protein
VVDGPAFSDQMIVAQRLDYFGTLGCPAPVPTAVTDIIGDQGGFVRLTFTRSDRDDLPVDDIDFYSIWRRLPEDLSKASGTVVAPDQLTFAAIEDLAARGRVLRPSPAGTPPGLWELAATQPAHHAALGYSIAVPTRFDASAVVSPGAATHLFFVSAHSVRPRIWWDSYVLSGFSIDNLAPAAPAGFTAEQPTSKAASLPIRMVLSWSPNSESDLEDYAIYRGSSSSFLPASPGDFIARVTGTTYVDSTMAPWSTVFYRVAAFDVHGNASPYTEARGGKVRTDTELQTSASYALWQNEPNPAHGSTLIRWSLAEDGPVRLTVYDVAGRAVRTLLARPMARGPHSMLWDAKDDSGRNVAAGTYFYRLEAGTLTRTRRLTLIR